ncbi:hypothetical protein ACOSQ4_015572 [Xanthoceras sorbifolium]
MGHGFKCRVRFEWALAGFIEGLMKVPPCWHKCRERRPGLSMMITTLLRRTLSKARRYRTLVITLFMVQRNLFRERNYGLVVMFIWSHLVASVQAPVMKGKGVQKGKAVASLNDIHEGDLFLAEALLAEDGLLWGMSKKRWKRAARWANFDLVHDVSSSPSN